MPRKHLLFITGVYILACVIYFSWSLSITEVGYPLDDAWIHQVFARNIATGHGFSFNPGIPISGATAPLWTLLMALIWPMVGPITGGIALCMILMWLALLASYKITLLITENKGVASLVFALCALCWPLIWGALSGMEIGLYCALSLWGLYFYLKAERSNDYNRYLAYLLLALSILSRPECALFLAAAITLDLWVWAHSSKRDIWPWVLCGLIVAIILLPYFCFNYGATGSLFPQTFAAKVRGRGAFSALIKGDIKHIIKSFTLYPYYFLEDFLSAIFWLCPMILIALSAGGIKLASASDKFRSKRIMILALVILYTPIMGVVAPVLTPTYHNMRVIINLLPLVFMIGLSGLFWKTEPASYNFFRVAAIISAALGVIGGLLIIFNKNLVGVAAPYLLENMTNYFTRDINIFSEIARETGRNLIILGALLILGHILTFKALQDYINKRILKSFIIAVIIAFLVIPLIQHAKYYAGDVKNLNEMDISVGKYLRQFRGQGKVAVGDIGAITYFSEMPILDLKGLVSPELPSSAVDNDSLAFEYMLRNDRAAFVAVFPSWFKYIVRRTDILKPIKRFVISCNIDPLDDTIMVYKAYWPSGLDTAGYGSLNKALDLIHQP